jgi:hypothetical protein|tara:strand:+ start:1738 stop:2010 length:273 start_codon:yes stop_codon:yes gene_type:complete
MSEVFFLEHKSIEVAVEAINADRIALEIGQNRYILTPSEASHVADMLTSIMKWDEDDGQEEEWTHEVDGDTPEYGWNEDIYNDTDSSFKS